MGQDAVYGGYGPDVVVDRGADWEGTLDEISGGPGDDHLRLGLACTRCEGESVVEGGRGDDLHRDRPHLGHGLRWARS